jgi:hypothetical protein
MQPRLHRPLWREGIKEKNPVSHGTSLKKNFWRRLAGRLLIAVLALQLGCSSQALLVGRTLVPGSNIYCLREIPSTDFRKNLTTSNAMYGPYKRGTLGGDSSICDLIQFYTYTVTWETKDGRKERYEFDLEKLMKKLQDENPVIATMTQHTSQPQLTIEYLVNQIQIYHRVSQYQPDGMEVRNGMQVLTKLPIVTKFPILTVPLTMPASAPTNK